MKFFITGLLLLSSLTALAAKEIKVELVADKGVKFSRQGVQEAYYLAANPTCQQMEPTPAFPIPVRRSESGNATVTKNTLTVAKSLSGYCRYKLNDVRTLLVRGINEHVLLTFYPKADAPSEIDLVCTRKGEFKCRERDENDDDMTYAVRLSISNTETTRINVTFE